MMKCPRGNIRQVAAFFLALTVALCISATPPTAAAAGADGDDLLVERWRLHTGEPPSGAPAGDDSAVFIVTDRGKIFAVDHDGKKVWQGQAGRNPAGGGEREAFTASPLLAYGTLVFGSRLGVLYAFDSAAGKELWRYHVGGPVTAIPTLLEGMEKDGASLIVINQSDGTVHNIELASGELIRISPSTNRCDGSAAAGGGTIAYGNCDAAIYLLSSKSLEIARKIGLREDGQVFAGVALDGGVVFAGDRRGRLYAADIEAGTVLWVNEESRSDVSSAPAVSTGRVVYTTDDGSVAAVDRRTGSTLWRRSLEGRPKGPVFSAAGRVVVSADGTLYLLSMQNGETLWSRPVSDEISAPAVIGGLVFVATDDGFLVAFGRKEKGKAR